MTLFSKRFERARLENRLQLPTFPYKVRRRIWYAMQQAEDFWEDVSDTGWSEYTSTTAETGAFLIREYGDTQLVAYTGEGDARGAVQIEDFVQSCYKHQFLDVGEAFYLKLKPEKQPAFQTEVNRVMGEENLPWRMTDGRFFQLDSAFLEAEVIVRAEELMQAHGFAGALEEFREARNDLTVGDTKGAIVRAQNAFESTAKTILGVSHGNAGTLIRKLVDEDFFGDLPPHVEASFGECVLKALPFMGNRLGRHGQGEEVVEVPRHYAELALHLTGSFIRLLIERHVSMQPQPVVVEPVSNEDFATASADDDIPF